MKRTSALRILAAAAGAGIVLYAFVLYVPAVSAGGGPVAALRGVALVCLGTWMVIIANRMGVGTQSPLQKIRLIEDQWKVGRWFLIVSGAVLLAYAMWIIRTVVPNGETLMRVTSEEQAHLKIQEPGWEVAAMAQMYAELSMKAYLAGALGGFCILWVLLRWRGNPVHQAVLKLDAELRGQDREG